MTWHDLTPTCHLIPCLWGKVQRLATSSWDISLAQTPTVDTACSTNPHVHSPGPDPSPALDPFPTLSLFQLLTSQLSPYSFIVKYRSCSRCSLVLVKFIILYRHPLDPLPKPLEICCSL